MAVHSTTRIIEEAVHQALPGDGTAAPWVPVADVDFKFMLAENDWDPEDPPSTSTDGSKPAVFIFREVQGPQDEGGHLGRAAATGKGIFRYRIFVQVGAGVKHHHDIDEEIRTKLDTFTDSPAPLGYVAFATETVVVTKIGASDGFYEIAYEVPATVIGDF